MASRIRRINFQEFGGFSRNFSVFSEKRSRKIKEVQPSANFASSFLPLPIKISLFQTNRQIALSSLIPANLVLSVLLSPSPFQIQVRNGKMHFSATPHRISRIIRFRSPLLHRLLPQTTFSLLSPPLPSPPFDLGVRYLEEFSKFCPNLELLPWFLNFGWFPYFF
jgi:hypothetical protein